MKVKTETQPRQRRFGIELDPGLEQRVARSYCQAARRASPATKRPRGVGSIAIEASASLQGVRAVADDHEQFGEPRQHIRIARREVGGGPRGGNSLDELSLRLEHIGLRDMGRGEIGIGRKSGARSTLPPPRAGCG